jgi:hypothetical protein
VKGRVEGRGIATMQVVRHMTVNGRKMIILVKAKRYTPMVMSMKEVG